MGIGKRNGEGYYDPTAYAGIKLAEPKQEKETVRLVYKNGRMELYIHEFFPCTAAVARRVFPLIRHYAKEEDKEKLRQFLKIKLQEHSGKMLLSQRKRLPCRRDRRTGIFTGRRQGKNVCGTTRR